MKNKQFSFLCFVIITLALACSSVSKNDAIKSVKPDRIPMYLTGSADYTITDTDMQSRAPFTAADYFNVLGGTGLRLCDLRNFYICEDWKGACSSPWDCNNLEHVKLAKIKAEEHRLNVEAEDNGIYIKYQCDSYGFCIGHNPSHKELQEIMLQKINKVQGQIDEMIEQMDAGVRKGNK